MSHELHIHSPAPVLLPRGGSLSLGNWVDGDESADTAAFFGIVASFTGTKSLGVLWDSGARLGGPHANCFLPRVRSLSLVQEKTLADVFGS